MADPYGQDPPVVANVGAPTNVSEKRIKGEKYLALVAGERRTISFSLAPSGLFQSGYMFPLNAWIDLRRDAPRVLAQGRGCVRPGGGPRKRRLPAETQRALAGESA